MDNTNSKPTVYKFGHKNLDLDHYIYNIGTNLQNYMDSKTNWTEDQKSEFLNSYNQYLQGLQEQLDTGNSRFSTNDAGVITDSLGLLSDIDNDGIDDQGSEYYYNDKGEKINTQDYNKLRKRKQKKYNIFQANREVASYLNTIGRALSEIPKEPKETDNKFDLAKHGFISYWQNLNNPMGGKMNLKPYLDMDLFDQTTGKRARTNRANYLAKEINNYLKQLKDYDFEDSNFVDSNTYKQRLADAAQHLADGTWDNNDIIALNQAGIGGDFQTAFFSEEGNPDLTEDQRKLLEEKEKKEKDEKLKAQQKEAYNKWIDDQLVIYDKNQYKWTKNNPYAMGKLDFKYLNEDGSFNGQAFRDSFKIDPNADNSQFFRTYFDNYLANPFTKEGSKALAGLIGMGYAQKLDNGYYYIPQSERDRRTNSGLIYDPTTGKLAYTFIGDIAPEWDRMNQQYKEMNGLINRRDQYSRFKEGGVINKYQIGGGFDPDAWMAEDRVNTLTQQGKKDTWNTSWHSGRDAEQEAAGNRKTFADPTMENPDNGFSNTDKLRLGTIAADIVSMGAAFVPGAGTAVSAIAGVGSSVGTFFADAFEDGLDWGDVKNLGANLGMDALGLIPGGGAASKGMKIAKNLGKYATRIIATVGALHTVANGDKIINSYNKLLSNPSELNVDDWRNISAGLGLVTGGVAAGTRKYKKAKAQAANARPDNIAVEFVDKNTGKKHTLAFTGDDAKNIRKAQKSGNIDDIRKVTTGKYEKLRNLDIVTGEGFQLRSPIQGWKFWKPQKPWTFKEKGVHVYDVYSDANGMYAKKGNWETDEYLHGITSDKAGKGLKKSTLQSEIDNQIASDSKQLDTELKRMAEVSGKYEKGIPTLNKRIENAKKQKQIIEEFLKEKPSSDHLKWQYLRSKNPVTQDMANQLEVEISTLQPQVAKGAARKTQLEAKSKRSGLTTEEGKEWTILKNNELALNKKQNRLHKLREILEIQREEQKSILKDKRISEAESIIKGINDKTFHSGRYKEFVRNKVTGSGEDAKIVQPSYARFRGDIQHSFKDLLSKYNIVYKHGGSLNTSNIRKFNIGGTSSISNTRSTANWFLDMFQSKQMQDWLNTFNQDNYESFNDLQKSWRTNLNESGYQPGISNVSKNQGVYDRQKQWNDTGTNQVITDLVTKGKLKPAGNSEDNADNNYQDGFFGEQEFLRHGGSKESWIGHEDELKKLQNQLAAKGLTYTLNPESNMYELGVLKKIGKTHLPVKKKSKNTSNTSFLDSYIKPINPTISYGFPRALVADIINRRMTNKAIDAEKPFLQNPFEKRSSVQSSLKDEMQGRQAAGTLNNLASTAITSDGDKNQAAQLEAASKGQDYIIQGKQKSDDILRQTSEISKQNEDFSAKNRHDTATQNSLSALQTKANINKYEQAYLAKQHNIWDTFAQELEKDAKNAELEKEALSDKFVAQDIHNAVNNDLKSYADITPEEEDVWNKVVSGVIKVSDLQNDPKKYNAYLSAFKKASQAEQDQLRKYKQIPKTKWSNVRLLSNTPVFTFKESRRVEKDENGTKLAVAKIKAKTEDAKLFQKSIKESIDRNEKILDRISKSLYSYIKASIVK